MAYAYNGGIVGIVVIVIIVIIVLMIIGAVSVNGRRGEEWSAEEEGCGRRTRVWPERRERSRSRWPSRKACSESSDDMVSYQSHCNDSSSSSSSDSSSSSSSSNDAQRDWRLRRRDNSSGSSSSSDSHSGRRRFNF
jgi:hypothetical protein